MDKKQPVISVIVPVYNAEKHLHRCIDSILNQTFTDFEVLLINDGSTDSSGIICEEYAEKDTRVRIFHKENGGVSSARNLGIKELIGTYVLFVDSDDSIEDGLLYYLTEQIFLKYPDCISFNGGKYDGQVQTSIFRLKADNFLYNNLLQFKENNTFCKEIWLHLFKSQIIRKYEITFSEGIRYAEDIEFFIKYSSVCNNILSTSFVGYRNYINMDSAMHKRFTKNDVIDHYRVVENLKDFYEEKRPIAGIQYYADAVYNLILTSVGFIHKENFRLCFWLNWYYKRYYITSIKIKHFSISQNVILFLMFLAIYPFWGYFKIRKYKK